jgi:hypothetical protein
MLGPVWTTILLFVLSHVAWDDGHVPLWEGGSHEFFLPRLASSYDAPDLCPLCKNQGAPETARK